MIAYGSVRIKNPVHVWNIDTDSIVVVVLEVLGHDLGQSCTKRIVKVFKNIKVIQVHEMIWLMQLLLIKCVKTSKTVEPK